MIHLQIGTPNWLEAVKLLPDRSLVKSVDQGGAFREVKEISPAIYTCLRHHFDSGQVFGGTYLENKKRARAFFETFVDATFIKDIAPYCDFIEEWNEYLANSQTRQEIDERILWATAAASVWQHEYRIKPELEHIRLVLCNTAIGNWIDRGFAVVARDYDALIGYHPYTLWQNKIRWGEDHPLDQGVLDTLDWVNLSGLWDTMEHDWGIKVDWCFTEAGPFESAVDGWRSDACLGGDRDLYVKAVRDWLFDVKTTPAYREDRIYGFAIYTTGRAGTTWKHYWTEQPELNMLATMIAQQWHMDEPPVVIPPEPSECKDAREPYQRTYILLPPEADSNWAQAVVESTWDVERWTIGGSADDAGIGCGLKTRTVIIVNPLDWPDVQHENDFILWYDEHYPGTDLLFIYPISTFDLAASLTAIIAQ